MRVLTKVRVALCVGCSGQYAHDRKACPPAPEATARAAWPGKPCHTRAGGRRERGEAVHEHWSTKGLRTSKFQVKEKTPACLTQRGWSSSLSLMSWTTCMARDQWSSAGGKGATRSVLNSPTGATFSQANKDRKGLRMVSRGVQHGVSGAVSEGFPKVSSYVSRVSAHLDHKKHLCFLRLLVLKIRPSVPFIILLPTRCMCSAGTQ